jgi:membrane protein YqaA with SNARE-associated domain
MRLLAFLNLAQRAVPRHPRRQAVLTHWLLSIGPLGLFAIAVMDSSVVPIPGSTDVLLVLLTVTRGNWFWMATVALLGSMIGGYLTYRLGVRGGKPVLRRYVPANRLAGIERRIQRNSFLAVLVPALLPPPVPLVPFVITAGALGMSRARFLSAYAIGRALRYSVIGWLGALYGRHLLRTWGEFSRDWAEPIVWGMIALAVGTVLFTVWQYRVQVRKTREQLLTGPMVTETGSVNDPVS